MSDGVLGHCRRCGRELTEPEYAELELCGDCYWDDQTDADLDIILDI